MKSYDDESYNCCITCFHKKGHLGFEAENPQENHYNNGILSTKAIRVAQDNTFSEKLTSMSEFWCAA